LTTLGYGVDPFSILVPFLVFAIGVSHGVQKICTFRNEIFAGHSGKIAARNAFIQLIAPGMVALICDIIGFITMMVIKITAIHELAITASLGVGVVIITNFFLLPILLSYLHLPESYARWVQARRLRTDARWARLGRALKPGPSLAIIAVSLSLGVWAYFKAEHIHIGDTNAGVPELRQNSRYNTDSRIITEKFSIGVDVLSVIVETIPNGCVDHDVVTLMDQFEGVIRTIPGVQSVVSLTTAAKTINAGFNEGSLKWRVLPRQPQALAQAVSPIETATGLLNADASVLPVLIFLADHKVETLRAVTAATEAFAAAHPSPKAKFLLASGNAGVMAATNEIVAAAQTPILLWVFGAVITLCLITFRSCAATLWIVLPLGIVSFLAYALMVYLGIGLKTSTLPVVALGVGIGVDYGIYLFARLETALKSGAYFEDAMIIAYKDTGAAIVFTGLTLAIGVSLWIFSDVKFQADMGILLTFMFLVNMLGAIILLPAMARWFWRHHSGPATIAQPQG
ncbi:MAG: MMPL family transporter, partial [Opitutaceae bacterium]